MSSLVRLFVIQPSAYPFHWWAKYKSTHTHLHIQQNHRHCEAFFELVSTWFAVARIEPVWKLVNGFCCLSSLPHIRAYFQPSVIPPSKTSADLILFTRFDATAATQSFVDFFCLFMSTFCVCLFVRFLFRSYFVFALTHTHTRCPLTFFIWKFDTNCFLLLSQICV